MFRAIPKYTELGKYHPGRGDQIRWLEKHLINSYISLHWHDFYELEFCDGGSGVQILNGETTPVKRGSVTLVTPNDFHRVISDEDTPISYYTLSFFGASVHSDVLEMIADAEPPYRIELEGEAYDAMKAALDRLYENLGGEDKISAVRVSSGIAGICADVVSFALTKRSENPEKKPSSLYQSNAARLQEAISYVNQHFSEGLTREEVASLVHLHPNYFSKLFKNRLGISFSDYVAECRLRRAKYLLQTTDRPIAEIIAEVGYSSNSLFYRKFGEYYEMSPFEMRENVRNRPK